MKIIIYTHLTLIPTPNNPTNHTLSRPYNHNMGNFMSRSKSVTATATSMDTRPITVTVTDINQSSVKSSGAVRSGPPIIVSIDGNIGSGKSVTLEHLKEYYLSGEGGNADGIVFIQEPVKEWMDIVDKDGVHILENLYKDLKRFAFRFQMMAYISRLKLLREACRDPNVRVIITERCVKTDRNVFAKMLYDDGSIEEDEYRIYNQWFDEFIQDVPVAGIVYVRASPEICVERITKRARPGEVISAEYINQCHTYHETWIESEKCQKLIISANDDMYSHSAKLDTRMADIVAFVDLLQEHATWA